MSIQTPLGNIQISNHVIAKIAGMTAAATEGIASMSTGTVENIVKQLSGKKFNKGIHVEASDSEVAIELSIIVTYGVKMHNVCRELQRNVREALERLAGIRVGAIHVNVDGISTK